MKAQIIVGARAQALFAWIMCVCVCVFAKTSQKLPKRTINRARDIDSYSNNVHDEWYQPHRFDPKLNMWQKNTQTKRRRRGREWKIYNKKSSQQLLMFLIHISMQVRNFANWQISFDDCCCCCWWCCCCLFACCTQFHNELITDKIQHTVDCYWYLGGMHFIHKNRSDAFFFGCALDTAMILIWIDKRMKTHSKCSNLIRIFILLCTQRDLVWQKAEYINNIVNERKISELKRNIWSALS